MPFTQGQTCKACHGKGYYSHLQVTIGFPDFSGDPTYLEPPKIVYKRCPKCKSRKKIPKDSLLNGRVLCE